MFTPIFSVFPWRRWLAGTLVRVSVESVPQSAQPATLTVDNPGEPVSKWPRARILAVTSWVTLTISWLTFVGPTTARAAVTVWLVAGLVSFSVGVKKWYGPLLDWSPFFVFWILYENARGFAYTLGRPALWDVPIEVDRWMFLGTVPTVWLQERMLPAEGTLAWWELPLALVYTSHFYAVFILAALLWWRNRQSFRRFILRLGAVLVIAVSIYIAFPTAPPWAAARCAATEVASGPVAVPCMDAEAPADKQTLLGPITVRSDPDIHHVQRITARGLSLVPGTERTVSGAISVGFNVANPVAALPSLHAACSMMVSVALWRWLRRRWRPVLAAYPLAMAFTLVITADHYVFDIILGWLLVAVVCTVASAIERKGAAVQNADEDGDPLRQPSSMR